MSRVRRDHPRCRSAMWICLLSHRQIHMALRHMFRFLSIPFIHSKFHWNPFRGLGAPGGRNLPIPITLAIGFYLCSLNCAICRNQHVFTFYTFSASASAFRSWCSWAICHCSGWVCCVREIGHGFVKRFTQIKENYILATRLIFVYVLLLACVVL